MVRRGEVRGREGKVDIRHYQLRGFQGEADGEGKPGEVFGFEGGDERESKTKGDGQNNILDHIYVAQARVGLVA